MEGGDAHDDAQDCARLVARDDVGADVGELLGGQADKPELLLEAGKAEGGADEGAVVPDELREVRASVDCRDEEDELEEEEGRGGRGARRRGRTTAAKAATAEAR